jgi:hypothetical protein
MDGLRRAKKTFSMILEMVFEMVWWRGRKWIFEVEVFFSSQNIDFPFYLMGLLELFSFLFLFFLCSVSWALGDFDDIWGENHFFKKPLFKWHDMEWHGHDYEYTSSGHIFWNGVMHINIAKPWLWRCEGCGYINGGCIFWSGGMHANISGWG